MDERERTEPNTPRCIAQPLSPGDRYLFRVSLVDFMGTMENYQVTYDGGRVSFVKSDKNLTFTTPKQLPREAAGWAGPAVC